MKREPTYVGIDVAKDRVDIAVRPTGQSWSASYEEEEVEKLVARLQGLEPAGVQDVTPMEELERLRAEFLGMVSHELRTPLAAVKGSVDTLLESASDLDSAEMTQFFRIIRDQSENMRYLISDLLDVARIETGTLPVSPEPVEAGVLVDEARSRFQSGGGRSNLVIDLPPDLPPDLPRVMADRRRIVQALGNLLSNAAHHSNELSPHPGGRSAGWRPRRLLGGGRRRGRARRAAAAPVPQVLPARRRGAGTGDRRVGPGTRADIEERLPGQIAVQRLSAPWVTLGDTHRAWKRPRACGWCWRMVNRGVGGGPVFPVRLHE